MESIIFLVLMILVGLFSIFCAIMNFNWFIESRKARFLLKVLGRTGTRIAYIVIGAAIIILALVSYFI